MVGEISGKLKAILEKCKLGFKATGTGKVYRLIL